MPSSWNKLYSPTITTSVITDSTTFSLVNTIATTVNAFGEATTITVGAATAALNFVGNALNFTNATSAAIAFGIGGAGAPTFTARSTGTKAVYYQTLSASSVDYGRGIAAATLWDSIPQANSGYSYKLYGGTTVVYTVRGDGLVTLTGDLATTATTKNVFNSTLATANMFGGVNTLNFGYTGTASSSTNFFTGATATGNNKTINIGTSGATGSFTNVTLGSSGGISAITVNGSLLVGINGSGYTPSAYATGGLNIAWNKNGNTSGATYFQNFRQGGSGGFIFELYDVNPTLISTPLTIDGSGNSLFSGYIKSSSASAGIGYATGAGGSVTQATSKTTAVTLNKLSGAITMNNASLNAGTTVVFTVNNSTFELGDTPDIIARGGYAADYRATALGATAGSFKISVTNLGTTQSEAVIIDFNIIKGVSS